MSATCARRSWIKRLAATSWSLKRPGQNASTSDDISPRGSGLAQAAFWLADDSWYGRSSPRRLGGQPRAIFTPGLAKTWPRFFAPPAKNKDLRATRDARDP